MADNDRMTVLIDKLTEVLRGESYRDALGSLGFMLTQILNDSDGTEKYWPKIRDSIENALPQFADMTRRGREATRH